MQTHECHAESLLNDYIYLSIYLFTKLLSVLLLLYPNVMTSFFYPVGDWETKVSPWITAGDRGNTVITVLCFEKERLYQHLKCQIFTAICINMMNKINVPLGMKNNTKKM